MDFLKYKHHFVLSLFFSLLAFSAFSQKMTVVKGTIVDADNNEPVMFANIAFVETNIGTDSDLDGKFTLESKFATDSMVVSCVGYATQTIAIEKFSRQTVNIALQPNSIELTTAVVKAKKRGYKRKDNPAVAIMKEVWERKGDNRIEGQDFYEYEKYEKVQFDLNNFNPEKMRKRRAFKKFQFLFDFVDTSELNGKPYLPFFIQETSSNVYYRKDPESKKEFREGVKVTGIEDYIDLEDFTTMLDVLYQEIDIYENTVRLLDLAFVSPLSPLANASYRFYLQDTSAYIGNDLCYKISFMPVNNQNIAFRGDLFILKDSSYAVRKADFGITKQANLNFVQDLKLLQEFTEKDGVWVLEKDKVILDFAVFKKGTGVFGSREVSYKDFAFGEKREARIYEGTENVMAADDAYEKDDAYWQSVRHDTLTVAQQGVYEMIDTLQKAPAFRTVMTIFTLAFTGYKAFGPVDIGPIGNFYSYNPVEGWRLKLGGETNLKFHPKLQFAGYGAYGTKDEEWKYGGAIQYSFREDFNMNPKHFLELSYQHEVNLVGQFLPFSSADNFFLSFQRGDRDRMLFLDKYKINYFLELDNNLSWDFHYTNTDQRAIGGLVLNYTDPETQEQTTLPELRTSELGVTIRFAPNEQYLQGRSYRLPIYNKFPVFTLTLNSGIEGMLGGDYSYASAKLKIFKRFYLSLFGSMRFEMEGGKYWGEGIPYFLLHLPNANQSFAYRTGAYNMMNYQEFVNDEYVSLSIEHYFKGFFFNKIPLLRKLKLREVVTFKGVYGQLSDKNNPNTNPEFIQFVEDDSGKPVSYTLEDKPYMEASAGVMNIFKFGRIDLVRRLTYLNNPDVPQMFGVKGLGIRFKLSAEF